jgi:hypothetical protein
MFTWDWSHQLTFPSILLQIYDDETSILVCQKWGKRWDSSWWTQGIMDLLREVHNEHVIPIQNIVIHGKKRWRSWAPDSRARRATHNDDRFLVPSRPQGLKSSTTTFQVAVRQPATTNSIDGPARPPIGIPSTTTQSSGLALSEIRTMNPKESVWSGIAIGQRLIPPASTQRSTVLRW